MTILIVEDDIGILDLLTELLNDAGLKVVWARTAAEAIEFLEKLTPEMMVLDYGLPDSNAKGFLDQLRKRKIPIPPFIVATGQGDEMIAVDMMKLGARDYIVKNIHFFSRLPEVILRNVKEIENDRKLKEAEDALKETQRMNEILLDTLPHPAMLIRRDRVIVAANRIVRNSGGKIGGFCWQEFAKNRFLSPSCRQYVEDNQKGSDLSDVKCRFCQADEMFDTLTPINDPQLSAAGKYWDTWWVPIDQNLFLHYVIDVTDRINQEKERLNMERKINRLQKAESLARMAGAVAHHFNNLLFAVTGNLEMASEEHKGKTTYIHCALEAAQKAVEISNLMLTYLGQEPAERRPMDISEVCRQYLPKLRETLPERIALKLDLPNSGPRVNADKERLQKVLWHLVINAAEAYDCPGDILLTVRTVDSSDVIERRRFPAEWTPNETSLACIEVADNGHGIHPDVIDTIFDPFFTSKFTGRGLGLAVVLGIVRSLGGGITVKSETNQGSVFRIYLPVLP